MLDLTRLARACGFLLLGYFVLFLLTGVGLAIWGAAADLEDQQVPWLNLLVWPLPLVFVLAALALLVDFHRRRAAGTLTSSQAVGYRVVAALQVVGSLFAWGGGHLWPALVAAGVLLVLLVPVPGIVPNPQEEL